MLEGGNASVAPDEVVGAAPDKDFNQLCARVLKDYRLKAGRIVMRLKVAVCGSSRLKAVPAESRLKAWWAR